MLTARARAILTSLIVAFVVGLPAVGSAHEGHGDHRHDGAAVVLERAWHPVSFAQWVIVGVVIGAAVVGGVLALGVVRRRRISGAQRP